MENYWWRIWGSRGRELCGATVARLFAEISDGHVTPPAWLINSRIAAQKKAAQTAQAAGERDPASQKIVNKGKVIADYAPKVVNEDVPSRPKAPKRNLTMPHPILKKTRGPSTNGPRPTARFISPQETPRISPGASESDENEYFDAEESSPNDHVIIRPPTPEWHDTEEEGSGSGTINGKSKRKLQIAVAAARNKRRPSLARRKSSQSSTNSDTITKAPVGKKAPTGKNLGGVLRHNLISQAQAKPAESRPKAAVKPHISAAHSNAPSIAKNRTGSGSQQKSDFKGKNSEASTSRAPQSSRLRQTDNGREPLTEEELHELNLQQTLLDEANAGLRRSKKEAKELSESRTSQGFQVAHKSLRSKSTSDAGGAQNLAALALHPKHLKNSPSLAPSHEAATGTLDLANDPFAQASTQKLDKGKGRAVDELHRVAINADIAEIARGKDMFPKRAVQARPCSTSMIDLTSAGKNDALSRSKSQLTLLLERDRLRTERAKATGRYTPRGPD